MNWMRFVLVVIVSGVIASVTDWAFMGMLFHGRYLEAPEIWRGGLTEGRKIAYSELIGLIACAAFAYLIAAGGKPDMASGLKMAVVVWLAMAVPILATFVLWLKLSPYIGASHAAGWLVRLLITAVAASLLL